MACHQATEWSVDNTLSVINIIVSVLAIIFSGVLVYILGNQREDKQEKNRKINLIKGLQSEMKVNEFFAEHNKGIAQRKSENPYESDNFILFRNASADEVLSYANIQISDEQREKIMKYLGVVEHVNSIIKEYQETKNKERLKAIINFSDIAIQFKNKETRSVPQIIEEVSQLLK